MRLFLLAGAILIVIPLDVRVGILNGSFWSRTTSTTRQIELAHLVTDTTFNARFPIITTLHDCRRKVICYFSAGSNKNWRRDAGSFNSKLASGLCLMDGQANGG